MPEGYIVGSLREAHVQRPLLDIPRLPRRKRGMRRYEDLTTLCLDCGAPLTLGWHHVPQPNCCAECKTKYHRFRTAPQAEARRLLASESSAGKGAGAHLKPGDSSQSEGAQELRASISDGPAPQAEDVPLKDDETDG